MGKIISEAKQLRFQLQVKLSRDVTIQEVADAIGVDRRVVARIEAGKARLYDAEIMERLGDFYHNAGIDTTNLIKYDPNKQRASQVVAA